ncbi:MAG: DUF3426 domain-containing protein, partial [Acidiferrobacterales bacterium]|nr:DUF3426 domain-containing protein [Acidiferrobacterales bacterium]
MFDAFASLSAKAPAESERALTPQQGQSEGPEAQPAVHTAQPAAQNAPRWAEEAQQATGTDGSQAVALDETPAAAETEAVGSNDDMPGAQVASADRTENPLAEDRLAGDQHAEDPAANLYEWEFKPAPRFRHSGLWLSLSLLLLLIGVFQAAFIFRTELMVIYPPLKPVYQLVCQRLACEIGLPRLRDQLNIEASDLRTVDPQRPNLVQLTALVRNRARVPVEYPAFELTLTNAQQQV